jgi:two-component system sensor histidine kinase DegS
MEEIGRLARSLYPGALDDLGLAVTIERYLAEYSSRHRIVVDHRIEGLKSAKLPSDMQVALFLILQEALGNAAKHSGARRVHIEFAVESSSVCMRIVDDGCGFDPHQSQNDTDRLGISGMQQRAELLGGELRIISEPGSGTRVECCLPRGGPEL